MSLEATAPITAKAHRLAELNDELMALATAFAEADRESVGLFERLGDQLMDWLRQSDDRPRCAFEPYLHNTAAVVRPPFGSVPGPAPGEAWEGLTTNRFLLSLKAFRLINQVFSREANWSVLEDAEPNVEVDWHYSRYEEGVRIAGVEVRNQSDSGLGVYEVRIIEFKVAPDGNVSIWRNHHQWLDEEDRYVSPNDTQILYLNQIDNQFPNDSRLHIQLKVTTVEYERMYRWPAWELDVATGQAVPAEPVFYDTD